MSKESTDKSAPQSDSGKKSSSKKTSFVHYVYKPLLDPVSKNVTGYKCLAPACDKVLAFEITVTTNRVKHFTAQHSDWKDKFVKGANFDELQNEMLRARLDHAKSKDEKRLSLGLVNLAQSSLSTFVHPPHASSTYISPGDLYNVKQYLKMFHIIETGGALRSMDGEYLKAYFQLETGNTGKVFYRFLDQKIEMIANSVRCLYNSWSETVKFVGVSVDGWKKHKQRFLAVCATMLDVRSKRLRSVLLDFPQANGAEDMDGIAFMIDQAIHNGIGKSVTVSAIVSDGAPAMHSGVRISIVISINCVYILCFILLMCR